LLKKLRVQSLPLSTLSKIELGALVVRAEPSSTVILKRESKFFLELFSKLESVIIKNILIQKNKKLKIL
jgi:hypothetical protein